MNDKRKVGSRLGGRGIRTPRGGKRPTGRDGTGQAPSVPARSKDQIPKLGNGAHGSAFAQKLRRDKMTRPTNAHCRCARRSSQGSQDSQCEKITIITLIYDNYTLGISVLDRMNRMEVDGLTKVSIVPEVSHSSTCLTGLGDCGGRVRDQRRDRMTLFPYGKLRTLQVFKSR